MTKESPDLSSRDVETVAARLRASRTPHAVATVVRTLSSTAAKPGMKALVLDNGEFAEGWLGGGCVTSAVQRAAKEAIRSGEATLVCLPPEELMADEDGAEQGGEGMVTLARNGCPSKGSMDIFVEPVVPQPELLVFGHGPVARALLRIAAGFGFTLASYGAAYGEAAPAAERRLGDAPPPRLIYTTPEWLVRHHATLAERGVSVGRLVVDEAHKAQGDYAYCLVARELARTGSNFRYNLHEQCSHFVEYYLYINGDIF